jgi:hypothetical protein
MSRSTLMPWLRGSRPAAPGPTVAGLVVRVVVMLAGVVLLVHGSLRGSDDQWPLGPMSQYAMRVERDADVVQIRAYATTAEGQMEVPLTSSGCGIGRSEVEGRLDDYVRRPAMLKLMADGWHRLHPDRPVFTGIRLVRETQQLRGGRLVRGTVSEQLATWDAS